LPMAPCPDLVRTRAAGPLSGGLGHYFDDNSATPTTGGAGASAGRRPVLIATDGAGSGTREVHGGLHAGLHGEAVKLCR
jgi:hypothetical protein